MPGGLTTSGVRASSRAPSGRSLASAAKRWEDEQELLLAERVGGELVARQGEVRGAELARAVADERSDAVGAVGFEHLDLHARVAFAEAADQRGHRVDRERRERGDLERARSQLDDAADRVAGVVDRSQDLAGGADQRLARGGQPQAAADSVKQLDAELALERAQRL